MRKELTGATFHRALAAEKQIDGRLAALDLFTDLIDAPEQADVFADECVLALRVDLLAILN